ncbi:MAG: hypothetical protein AVDCRST_MAG80-860 [uncultured Rubrobacteraceae bacterium]|uniref:Uncharacterized protein n=1 Tax=uncultured Rubrobacteraceae bacterium TaxID=349277 RepID=A0A6J4Q5A8_9ACTN|nr:MAG: hypothetical protein AVDCRST_MAG80-860 [uncultured Rubrobacteraceae bacterium]
MPRPFFSLGVLSLSSRPGFLVGPLCAFLLMLLFGEGSSRSYRPKTLLKVVC